MNSSIRFNWDVLQVNEFLVGAGTDAPEVEEENALPRTSISYDDMWAKQLLEASENEVMLVHTNLLEISRLSKRNNEELVCKATVYKFALLLCASPGC